MCVCVCALRIISNSQEKLGKRQRGSGANADEKGSRHDCLREGRGSVPQHHLWGLASW